MRGALVRHALVLLALALAVATATLLQFVLACPAHQSAVRARDNPDAPVATPSPHRAGPHDVLLLCATRHCLWDGVGSCHDDLGCYCAPAAAADDPARVERALAAGRPGVVTCRLDTQPVGRCAQRRCDGGPVAF